MSLVEPYSDAWPAHFLAIEQYLAQRVPFAIAIEHVGSTSVPGMTAKPIIDVDVVVSDGSMRAAVKALSAAGYAHQGELGSQAARPTAPRLGHPSLDSRVRIGGGEGILPQ